jgi:hypothetical protein
VDPGWEVVDDLPGNLPVVPGELIVIETYLARLLDESLKAAALGIHFPAREAAKEDGEYWASPIKGAWLKPR